MTAHALLHDGAGSFKSEAENPGERADHDQVLATHKVEALGNFGHGNGISLASACLWIGDCIRVVNQDAL